jgi:hypothetical protein
MDFELLDIVLRLGAAVVAGALIGINRDLRNKPIGMRTLELVALGAALVSIATIQFQGLGTGLPMRAIAPRRGRDPPAIDDSWGMCNTLPGHSGATWTSGQCVS